MYYSSFRIQNFKGIKDTTIDLTGQSKTGVFAFVGLNESGKTTILEAIHSFSPDYETNKLVGGEGGLSVPFKERVPRHLISNFTGDVSVAATIKLEDSDKEKIIEALKSTHNIVLDPDTLGDEVTIERHQVFKRGDLINKHLTLRSELKIKKGRQRTWKNPNFEEKEAIKEVIYNEAPDIAYFPTFVFDFPKRIFLTEERGGTIGKFYRGVFQDILDYDGKGLTIKDSIVRRIRSDDKKIPWEKFISEFSTDDKSKIQHVLDRAASVVTRVVFGRWNEIFGEGVKGKEIDISFGTTKGMRKDESGAILQTDEHDIYINFQIKDGTRRFDVNDRSLGFRWFFAFMLFTQFRAARKNTRPVLFLFDEPASNLHAASQQKLIQSFPEIAKGSHTLAYTTHSHYMVEPKWLEQTFIVTNREDAPNDPSIDMLLLDDESLDIQASRYRFFVNKYPNKISYFQPVLDRLDVAPSRFDIEKHSVVLEGKSDYYILRYAAKMLGKESFSLLPGVGASTFGALISLSIGWNLNMLFVLDGDPEGKRQRERYVRDYGIAGNRVVAISQLIDGAKIVEDLLDYDACKIILSELRLGDETLKKNQIMQYFQESLARDEIHSLGSGFESNMKRLFDGLERRIPQTDNALDSGLP